jgi:hypothetical protein
MTGKPPEDPLNEVCESFFTNPRNRKPNIKKLARALRSGRPLPLGFRAVLAEMLDSRLPGNLACNWQLKPHFGRRYDKAQRADEIEDSVVREIDAACERGLTVTAAVEETAGKIGKSPSSVWDIWNKCQYWRRDPPEQIRKAMEEGARKYLEECKSRG